MSGWVDWSPAAQMAAAGAGVAAFFVLLWWRRHRQDSVDRRLRALTWLTLFLTFDLIVFGAFTRLSDSGLGCPDWPGCYGQASPLGAQVQIDAEQAVLPSGPVTHGKAWIEMIHRYLATAVGALITLMAGIHLRMAGLRRRTRPKQVGHHGSPSGRLAGTDLAIQPAWTLLLLAWVCSQGLFGALTVTLKLYPAIVTGHLLGGVGLLALLAVLAARQAAAPPPPLTAGLRRAMRAMLALAVVQVALGGWVSTNYAVLACRDFPTCQGQWWPAMDFGHGFSFLRDLGQTRAGGFLPFDALTAIHLTHRLGALVVFTVATALVWALHRSGRGEMAAALGGMLLWQLATGVSNVVLGWPLVAALGHTAGAAALVAWLSAQAIRPVEAGQTASPPYAAGGMLAT